MAYLQTILNYLISYCFRYTFYFNDLPGQSSFVLKQPQIILVSSLESF